MKRGRVLFISVLAIAMNRVTVAETPESYLEKLADTPDLMQSLPEARLNRTLNKNDI